MIEKLILRLEVEMRSLESGICDTPPEDFSKFRELVGRRNGLRQAIQIILELRKDDYE